MTIKEVEQAIGYTFCDKKLLERALTLPSYSTEHNQSLEWLGDAILEFVVSEKLFQITLKEGQLTDRRKNVVEDEALAQISKRLKLDKALKKGKGDTSNKKAIPSVYEAVIAAIYLDGGLEKATAFILRTVDFQRVAQNKNYKGLLQEYLQAQQLPLPVYENEEIGTAQQRRFSSRLTLFGNTYHAEGNSYQEAEKQVAKQAYQHIKNKK